MTTMSEQVEAEQTEYESEEEEAAEAEPDEPDEPDEPEPDEPEALATIGPEEIRKAERAIAAQRKRLASILGDEYVAHECLLCTGTGFLPELPPPGTTLGVMEDEDGLTLAIQAPPTEPDYQYARDKGPCDWCDAEGFVKTHSKNPRALVAPCGKCQGNGWITVAADLPAMPPPFVPEPIVRADGSPMPTDMGVDTWGRPFGHAHWGVPPASIPG